jgi:hypothetical protein
MAKMLLEGVAKGDTKEQLKALTLLRKGIVTLDDNAHPFMAAGPTFLDAIYTLSASPNLAITYEALWIINNLCYSSFTRQIISKPDYLDFLINDRLVHPHSPAIRAITVWILANVAADPQTQHLLTCSKDLLPELDATCGPMGPDPGDPRRWTSTDLPPRLASIGKDLGARHDAGTDIGNDLEVFSWLLSVLARPPGRRITQTTQHSHWHYTFIFPILEELLFKPLSSTSPAPLATPAAPFHPTVTPETHTLRQEMPKEVYASILTDISYLTLDEDYYAMEVLVKRPVWIAFTVQWLHRCMAEGMFDEIVPAVRIAETLVAGSVEMATFMIKASIIDIFFVILHHPHCPPMAKDEAALGLSNIAIDEVYFSHLLRPDYIERAVHHWSKGSKTVAREFGYFFYHLLQMHDVAPGPLFELLAPTPFYEVLKRSLTTVRDQTMTTLAMRICHNLIDLGHEDELYTVGIDEAIVENISVISFHTEEANDLASLLVGFFDGHDEAVD